MFDRLLKKIDYLIGPVAIFAFLLLFAEHMDFFDAYASAIKNLNFAVVAVFIFEIILKFFAAPDKKRHLARNWFDLIVVVPLVQLVYSFGNTPFFVIARQTVIIAMLISRTRKLRKFVALLSLKPAQLMVTSFAFAIGVGTILLMLPAATIGSGRLALTDALFTATSATCVTGLIVVDTATHFSVFGQTVILALIQIGGLGIMTFSVSLAVLMKRRIEIKQEIVMQDVLDQDALSSVRRHALFILKMTMLIEAAGAGALFFVWRNKLGGPAAAAYHAVFHSVSAFCNAGFSTFSDSLMRFSADVPTNAVIATLIIGGGIGFTVIRDFYEYAKKKFRPSYSLRPHKFKVQTKMAVVTSVVLTVVGGAAIYFADGAPLISSGAKERIILSAFQSVSARTAGFNTCDIARLSPAALLAIMALMFIGASPGSTGGGVKTTTAAVLWAVVKSGFKKKPNVEIYKRTIGIETIQKALTVVVTSALAVCVFAGLLLYFERQNPLGLLFETVSAFGTVGLSTGVTPNLTRAGKIVITLLMFFGRLGPLTIGYAFARPKQPPRYLYAEEKVVIG